MNNFTNDAILKNESESLERTEEMDKRNAILSEYHPKQLPNGRWQTRVHGKLIIRKELSSLEDAILKAEGFIDVPTINNLWKDFLVQRKHQVEPTTWSRDIYYYETYIRDSKIADKNLKRVNLSDGYEFFDRVKSIHPKITRHYWKNVKGTLFQIIGYAVATGYIADNPLKNMVIGRNQIEKTRRIRDQDTVFSRKEAEAVMAIAEEEAFRKQETPPLGIVLLFQLGLRVGELLALEWGDIEEDSRGSYIHIQREMVGKVGEDGKVHGTELTEHTKTEAGDRRLLLNSKARSVLAQIARINDANSIPNTSSSLIFQRLKCGSQSLTEASPCTNRAIDARLRTYCKRAGMTVIKSPHDIRRTVLTSLYEAHMPLKKIQEFAGHSSLQQTMDYIRITDDDLDTMRYLDTLYDSNTDNLISYDFGAKRKSSHA